jgi:hypothetical protein
MSGYITARNLAQQLQMAPIVQLLQLSLGEEENAAAREASTRELYREGARAAAWRRPK